MRDKNQQGEKPSKDPAVRYIDPKTHALNPNQQSRRDFLEGTGAAVVAGAGVSAIGLPRARAQESVAASRTAINITVNGIAHSLEADHRWTLAELLRDELDLTGTKIGCNRSECGACTILMESYLGRDPSTGEMAQLHLLRVLSDLREAMWSYVQIGISTLDVDFHAYGMKHLNRFLENAKSKELKTWLGAVED